MNFEKIIDIASELCMKTVVILITSLVIINIARCSPSDSLNTYQLTTDWCGSCPVANNYTVFKLSDTLQGQFLKDYGVRSIYDKIVTTDELVCTATQDQVCIAIEVWRNGVIYKTYK